ncbi:hypothetical protein DPEC_G00343430 [Dallia pectoralis]|uniref:Uncharacterized protein n=1 Tax=Dallia pectoralis TaxID=75939 RepID=A0ACC2F2Z9_DALPE|nr:hypothetical protein DPEC_G00343430 [Dallia pectoralis]
MVWSAIKNGLRSFSVLCIVSGAIDLTTSCWSILEALWSQQLTSIQRPPIGAFRSISPILHFFSQCASKREEHACRKNGGRSLLPTPGDHKANSVRPHLHLSWPKLSGERCKVERKPDAEVTACDDVTPIWKRCKLPMQPPLLMIAEAFSFCNTSIQSLVPEGSRLSPPLMTDGPLKSDSTMLCVAVGGRVDRERWRCCAVELLLNALLLSPASTRPGETSWAAEKLRRGSSSGTL